MGVSVGETDTIWTVRGAHRVLMTLHLHRSDVAIARDVDVDDLVVLVVSKCHSCPDFGGMRERVTP